MLPTDTRKPPPIDLPKFPATIYIDGRAYVRESQLDWLISAHEAVSLGQKPSPPPTTPPKGDRLVTVMLNALELEDGRPADASPRPPPRTPLRRSDRQKSFGPRGKPMHGLIAHPQPARGTNRK
jgi:hypothetical protein